MELSATQMTHLDRLEAESIHIFREVMAEALNPVMLYSIGKDSSVMLHVARKAFYPSSIPFPLLHVDTRWKFQEMYRFREQVSKDYGVEIKVHINPEGIEKNINPFDHGSAMHTDIMKTEGLKQALDLYQFDIAFGGERVETRKNHELRSVSLAFEIKSIVGRPKPSVLSCGVCITGSKDQERAFGSSPSPIGQNRIFGSIFIGSSCRSSLFIWPLSVRSWSVMAY